MAFLSQRMAAPHTLIFQNTWIIMGVIPRRFRDCRTHCGIPSRMANERCGSKQFCTCYLALRSARSGACLAAELISVGGTGVGTVSRPNALGLFQSEAEI